MQVDQLHTSTGQLVEGPLLITPQVFGDDRGFFFESWNQRHFDAAVGEPIAFSQDNHSRSSRGAIFDVAVDLRRSSPTFGQWVGAELSGENQQQLWVPVGFAHGFWSKTCERSLLWSDPEVGISWPLDRLAGVTPLLADKDAAAPSFAEAVAAGEVFG